MVELLVWLSKFEFALAAALSQKAAGGRPPESQRLLSKVTAGKRRLSKSIVTASSKIKKGHGRKPIMPGLKGIRQEMDETLAFLAEAIASGIEDAQLAELLAHHEYVKWNGLFLEVAAAVKDGFPEATQFLARAQRHKKALEAFIEAEGTPNGLFRLRASEPVWRERFLLIGSVSPHIESGLRKEGIVERSANGRDAIERLSERYYGALVADEDLADLAGVELCRKAARRFPGIEERFLFLYNGVEKKGRLSGMKPRRLHKSARHEAILEEVGLILDR